MSYMCVLLNATSTPEFSTLSLHDALPICSNMEQWTEHVSAESSCEPSPDATQLAYSQERGENRGGGRLLRGGGVLPTPARSEEHTSELQSLTNLVCRLLLEKKKKQRITDS